MHGPRLICFCTGMLLRTTYLSEQLLLTKLVLTREQRLLNASSATDCGCDKSFHI